MRRGSLGLVAAAVVLGALLLAWSRSKSPPSGLEAEAGASAPVAPVPTPEPFATAEPSRAPSAAPSGAPDAATTTLDRAKRDEIRRRIYQAFGGEPPEGAGPRHATTAEERDIDHEYIERHIHEDFLPMARECHRTAAEKHPDLQGKLVMVLRVVGDEKVGGIVESTEIEDGGTLRDPEMLDCLQNSMASVAMPPPKSGGSLTIKVPMRFLDHDPDGEAW